MPLIFNLIYIYIFLWIFNFVSIFLNCIMFENQLNRGLWRNIKPCFFYQKEDKKPQIMLCSNTEFQGFYWILCWTGATMSINVFGDTEILFFFWHFFPAGNHFCNLQIFRLKGKINWKFKISILLFNKIIMMLILNYRFRNRIVSKISLELKCCSYMKFQLKKLCTCKFNV